MPQSNQINYDGSSSVSSFGKDFYAAFKQIYGPARVEPHVYNNKPFLRDCRKVDDFEGPNYAHSIFFEDPQGGSTSFQQAALQQNASSQSARFTIWRSREYQVLRILNEEIEASRSQKGALLKKKVYEMGRVLNQMGYRHDIALHNGGSGIIGSVTTGNAASLSTTTLTLDQPGTVVKFAKGMWLQLSTTNPNDGTPAALANGGATVQVVAVQRSSVSGSKPSTITISQPLSTWIPSAASSTQYFLLRAGDGVGFGQNVLNGGTCGLKCWLPPPPPVGQAFTSRLSPTDNFWGYNRNVDEQRLAGCTYQAQPGDKYTVTWQKAGQELQVNGGGNELGKMMLYVSPEDYTGYSLELGPNVRYAPTDDGSSGFKRLLVYTQAGDMVLTADPQIEPGLFYMLDKDSYYIKTLGALPHLDESDGNSALRTADADAQEIRWRSWYQLVFDNPGGNLVGRCA